MISKTKQLQIYLLIFLVSTSLSLLIIFGANYLFLFKSQEFATFDTIYNQQNSSDLAIYGSSIIDDVKQYKLFAYSKKQPKIVTLGSSRSLQFRERFFNQSFYNLGYTMSSIEDGLVIVDQLLKIHVPDVVIINLDFWWFNDNVNHPTIPKGFFDRLSGQTFKFKYLKYPFEWLKTGSITSTDYFSVLFHKSPNIGIRGILRNAGIGSDGSYYYTDIVTGDPRLAFHDKNFADIKQRIDSGARNLEYGKVASASSIKTLEQILYKLNEKHVRTLLFLPPLPTEVLTLLNNNHYQYIQDLKTQLAQHHIKIYDYSEPVTLNSNSCEFVDGFHGGDVLYSRILDDLANKENFLDKYINRQVIKNIIAKDHGKSFSPDTRVTTRNETDFLAIGCNKA